MVPVYITWERYLVYDESGVPCERVDTNTAVSFFLNSALELLSVSAESAPTEMARTTECWLTLWLILTPKSIG